MTYNVLGGTLNFPQQHILTSLVEIETKAQIALSQATSVQSEAYSISKRVPCRRRNEI